MTYAELVAAIKSYTESDFSTVDVNLFITQAETRIYNTVQIAYLRKNVTGTITINNKYLAVPDDWLAPLKVNVCAIVPLVSPADPLPTLTVVDEVPSPHWY